MAAWEVHTFAPIVHDALAFPTSKMHWWSRYFPCFNKETMLVYQDAANKRIVFKAFFCKFTMYHLALVHTFSTSESLQSWKWKWLHLEANLQATFAHRTIVLYPQNQSQHRALWVHSMRLYSGKVEYQRLVGHLQEICIHHAYPITWCLHKHYFHITLWLFQNEPCL